MTNPAMEEDHQALTQTTFLILLCVAKHPIHGYGIIKEVTDMTEGRLKLSISTLYGALNRMLHRGWLTRDKTMRMSTRERIEYRITKKGMSVLNTEIRILRLILNFYVEADIEGCES